MKINFRVLGVILLTILLNSCKKEEEKPTVPVVTTTSITGITQISANSGGNVSDDGGAEVSARGVCWGTSSNPTISGSKTTNGAGKGGFTSNIRNLLPNTKYYVNSYATNSAGTAYGNELSFTTNPIVLATLTTTEVNSITYDLAISGGNITDDGGDAIIDRGICWSTSASPTINDNKTSNGIGIGSFTSGISGIIPGVTYYIRAYATNSSGTAYGNEIIFSNPAVLPSVSTAQITEITSTTGISGGNVSSDGGSEVTSRGVCWSTSQFPTIYDRKSIDGNGTGIFISTLTDLTPNTTYYFSAYATNNIGTSYGLILNFKTSVRSNEIIFNPNLIYGAMTDLDGNIYKTIQIDTQTWMAENLRTTKYNDGTSIPYITDGAIWATLSTPGYCWYDNDDTKNKNTYGALYNWYTVNTGKLCPAGWHEPTYSEWTTLYNYLGGADIAGGKLKETGTNHWESPNTGASNESGFTALPGGQRGSSSGTFVNDNYNGFWWTVTEYNAESSWYSLMGSWYNGAESHAAIKKMGNSVRCVKDN